MCWQNRRDWIVRYIIVFLIGIPVISLTWGQLSILEAQALEGGIFSPDGNLLAVRTGGTEVLIFDTDSVQQIETLSTTGKHPYRLAFSLDSRYLAWREDMNGGVGVWDLSTFEQVAYFDIRAFAIVGLVFVPGGEFLAASVVADDVGAGSPFPGVVHFWEVGTWKKHGAWHPQGNGSAGGIAFTPDGEQFLVSATRGGVGEWVTESFTVDVETLRTIDVHEGENRIHAFSPDGRFVVVPVDWGNRVLLIRDAENDAEIALLSDPVVGYLYFRSISPDGKLLATLNWGTKPYRQSEVILWDTQIWEMEHRLALPAGQSIALGFVKDTYWYAGIAPTGELRIWDLIAQDSWTGVSPLPDMKITTWGYIREIR